MKATKELIDIIVSYYNEHKFWDQSEPEPEPTQEQEEVEAEVMADEEFGPGRKD